MAEGVYANMFITPEIIRAAAEAGFYRPVGSLAEVSATTENKKTFKRKHRSLGRLSRKLFQTPKPLVTLSKVIKRLRELPLAEKLVPRTFEKEKVTDIRKVVGIMGVENIDVHSSLILKLFSFDESSPDEKGEFIKDVISDLTKKLAGGTGVLPIPGDEPDVRSDDSCDDTGEEKMVSFAADGSKETEEGACALAVDKSSEVPLEDEVISTIKTIVCASELEVYLCDTIELTAKYYAKNGHYFPKNVLTSLRCAALELSKAVEDYTDPLLTKYPMQTFCLALKTRRMKIFKDSFPVALFNLKREITLKCPLYPDLACESFDFACFWIYMFKKMKDSEEEMKDLEEKVECGECDKMIPYEESMVLDRCNHSYCPDCIERCINVDTELYKSLRVARCRVCECYFFSYISRENFIELRNRLVALNAFALEIPANRFPPEPTFEK